MTKDALRDREASLEAQFFAKQNEELKARLRQRLEDSKHVEGLRELASVSDDELLERLVQLGVKPSTWAAVSLIPLVEVAWADGNVKEAERRAVLAAAEANGVDPNGPGYELLQNWLESRPDARLFATWGEYVVGLCEDLTPSEREGMRDVVLGRARAVAEAAGGILGLVNKISPEEKVVLGSIEKAFKV